MGSTERQKTLRHPRDLPEPLSAQEKRAIQRQKKLLEMTESPVVWPPLPLPLSPSRSSHPNQVPLRAKSRAPKRTRDQIEEENELDGEDRLKLGRPLKKKPIERTGRFASDRYERYSRLLGRDSGGVALEEALGSGV
jgi:hypothetical protein